jgi:hypothetical protein
VKKNKMILDEHNEKELDETQIYVSPSKENCMIFVDGEWKKFVRVDVPIFLKEVENEVALKTLNAFVEYCKEKNGWNHEYVVKGFLRDNKINFAEEPDHNQMRIEISEIISNNLDQDSFTRTTYNSSVDIVNYIKNLLAITKILRK